MGEERDEPRLDIGISDSRFHDPVENGRTSVRSLQLQTPLDPLQCQPGPLGGYLVLRPIVRSRDVLEFLAYSDAVLPNESCNRGFESATRDNLERGTARE